MLIDVLSFRRRNEGGDDEVDVGKKKEYGNRQCRPYRREEVVFVPVEVEVNQAQSDESVDDRQRVRNNAARCRMGQLQLGLPTLKLGDSLDHKVVSVTWRRSEHDDDRNYPVLEKTRQRGIERLVACPESRERENSLASQFLNHYLSDTIPLAWGWED